MRSAKKSSILSYISVVFYVVVGFLYTPYLVRILGVSDYGIYSLCASLIGYFTIDFGISAAQTRLAAKYIAEGTPDKIGNMLGITTRIFLTIDVVILILSTLVFFNVEILFHNLSTDEIDRFRNVFIVTTLFVVVNLPMLPIKGLFQAFDRVYELTLIDLCYKITNVAVIVGALYFGLGLYGVVFANVGSNIIAQICRLYFIMRQERIKINIKARDREVVKFITSFSLWATLAMVADKFFFGFIPFLLAVFSNTKEVAIFAIVISIEGYVLTISKSLNGIFLPRIMKMVVNNESSDDKTKLMIKVGRIQLYIIGLLVVGLICLGKEFIELWLGPGFTKSYYCVVLVMSPCIFHLTQTIAEEMLLATNKVKYRAYAYVIGSTISVSLIALLAPRFGALAAAIGVCASFVVAHNIVIDCFYHKHTGINMVRFINECHVKILPILIICLGIGFVIQYLFPADSFPLFILKALIWGALSSGILYALAFNQEERAMVNQVLRIKSKNIIQENL
ncbi:MAG: oligosaccharide flippase family protein [Bacteroidales bacterium]|nr:oligosaccharide flippase family protein [Bacteroidales bacterium]